MMERLQHREGKMSIRSTYIRDKKLYSISVGKNFDFANHSEFIASYEQLPIEAKHIELDMRKTSYIDHSTLRMILLMNKCVRDQVPTINIVCINPDVKRIFDLSRFKTFFKITEDREVPSDNLL